MSRWGKPNKNKRKINPRYHLSDTNDEQKTTEQGESLIFEALADLQNYVDKTSEHNEQLLRELEIQSDMGYDAAGSGGGPSTVVGTDVPTPSYRSPEDDDTERRPTPRSTSDILGTEQTQPLAPSVSWSDQERGWQGAGGSGDASLANSAIAGVGELAPVTGLPSFLGLGRAGGRAAPLVGPALTAAEVGSAALRGDRRGVAQSGAGMLGGGAAAGYVTPWALSAAPSSYGLSLLAIPAAAMAGDAASREAMGATYDTTSDFSSGLGAGSARYNPKNPGDTNAYIAGRAVGRTTANPVAAQRTASDYYDTVAPSSAGSSALHTAGQMAASPVRAIGNALDYYFQEGIDRTDSDDRLLTESQVNNFQKLAGIRSSKKTKVIKEMVDPISVASAVIIIAGAIEMQSHLDDYARSKGTPRRGQSLAGYEAPIPKPITGAVNKVKSLWSKLTSKASADAQQGNPSLQSLVDTIETKGSEQIKRLSPEQIASIQQEFGDDEQLASMLAQLADAPPESYSQILSQIEQHIRGKAPQ